MSHIEYIQFEINDLECLDAAVKELGIELVRGQKKFKSYFSSDANCDHAIRIPGNSRAYEVGVTKQGNSFRLATDFFQGGYGMEEKIGSQGMKLKQEYAAQVAMKDRRKAGYRVTRTTKEDGRIVLRAIK